MVLVVSRFAAICGNCCEREPPSQLRCQHHATDAQPCLLRDATRRFVSAKIDFVWPGSLVLYVQQRRSYQDTMSPPKAVILIFPPSRCEVSVVDKGGPIVTHYFPSQARENVVFACAYDGYLSWLFVILPSFSVRWVSGSVKCTSLTGTSLKAWHACVILISCSTV